MELEIPIELECFMLKYGILPREHRQSKPDIVWPEKKDDRMISTAWKPTEEQPEPPF